MIGKRHIEYLELSLSDITHLNDNICINFINYFGTFV